MEEGYDGLRDWLMEKLEPICDAEPGTLADYVLSLLKNDMPRKELAEMCEKELADFLDHNTQASPPTSCSCRFRSLLKWRFWPVPVPSFRAIISKQRGGALNLVTVGGVGGGGAGS